MRFNKILPLMLIALSSTLLQSCLKDQEDVFDDPTSLRVQEVLDNTKKILTSADNGWVFEYYPDRNLRYGGYIYTVKFDDAQATVGCELAPGTFESSLYKMTADNGPTLSFDSYNSLMHFFSTPSSGSYEAYDGDFEFAIMDVTSDLVKLRGKRTGNIMYMRRLEGLAATYLDGVANIADNMVLTSATGTAGSLSISAAIDLDARYMDIYWGEAAVVTDGEGDGEVAGEDKFDGNYFVLTPTGIRFMAPVKIADATIEELVYDVDNMTYTGTDSEGNAVILAGELPADYAKFDEFAGEFVIKYSNGLRSMNVTLVPDKANNRFIIQGLSSAFEPVATYSKAKGCLEINSQQVGASGSVAIWMCAWALDPAVGTGSLTWDTTAGMFVVKDVENPGTFNFVTNSNPEYNVTSFVMWTLTNGSSTGQAAAPWVFSNGTTQFTYLTTLVKK